MGAAESTSRLLPDPVLPVVRVPQAPAVTVMALVGAGLVIAARGHWRAGAGAIGLGLLLGAGLRLSLPPRSAGWLVVRSRAFDAALLVVMGLGVLVLAVTIPHPA